MKHLRVSDGPYLNPVEESSVVTTVTWRHNVELSSISRCTHIVRCYRFDRGLETCTPTINDYYLMHAGESSTADAGENE